MSYTNAVFFMDPSVGSDAVRATLSGVTFANPAGSTVRGTKASHGLVTGAIITVSLTTNWNGSWKVTRIDANNFDLDGAVWTAGADNTGDVVPFGGSSWADAWATVTSGASSARLAGGGTVKHVKSPDPVSVGDADWENGPVPDAQSITSSTNTTPIVMTKNSHGYLDGDFVQVFGHSTNTNANGVWKVANKTGNTFELEGSVGNGVGGATGTVQQINARVVRLDDASITRTLDRCETDWVGMTGLITSIEIAPTLGGAGYTIGDILTITDDGTLGTVEVIDVLAGVVTEVALVTSGHDYVTGAGKATSGGTGAGCTVEIIGAANVTAAASDAKPYKQGSKNLTVLLPNGTTKGTLLAYKAISPGSLAGFQDLSYWLTQTATPIQADEFRICLCSDAVGAVVVDEFVMEEIDGAEPTAVVQARTGGGNLGAVVGSIAIYTHTTNPDTDRYLCLDNFLATLTGNLNHQALIGKGDGHPWFPVQSINGEIVILDTMVTTQPADTGRGYTGDTETVETFVRETIKAVGTNTVNASSVTFSGGWDSSSGLQDGETFLDGRSGEGIGLAFSQRSHVTVEKFNLYRYSTGVDFSNYCQKNTISLGSIGGNTYGVAIGDASRNTFDIGFIVNNNYGLVLNGTPCAENDISVDAIDNNKLYGIQVSAADNNIIRDAFVRNNGSSDGGILILSGNGNRFIDIETADNETCAIWAMSGTNYLRNAVINETNEFHPAVLFGGDPRVHSHNHNNSGQHRIFTEQAVIDSLPTTRSGGKGLMWRIGITGFYGVVRNVDYPVTLALGDVGVDPDKLTTIEAWMKKDHATNVDGKLRARGGRVEGVDETIAVKSDDTDWEKLQLQFTPTESGYVPIDIMAEYVSGNSYVYVDDLPLVIQET